METTVLPDEKHHRIDKLLIQNTALVTITPVKTSTQDEDI